MDSLKIPDDGRDLIHDCENCEALCCASLKLDSKLFPILEDKPAGVPCYNLEVRITQNIFKCKIHDQLKDNWKICAGYSCYGAGQEVSRFFSELGFSLETHKSKHISQFEYNIRKQNLETAFIVLVALFELLKDIEIKHGVMAYALAKKSIEIDMELFSLEIESLDLSMHTEKRNEWLRVFVKKITYTLKYNKINIEDLIVDLFS